MTNQVLAAVACPSGQVAGLLPSRWGTTAIVANRTTAQVASTLSQWLPSGAMVTALRNAVYFLAWQHRHERERGG